MILRILKISFFMLYLVYKFLCNYLIKFTLKLFTIISSGEYLINGFSNKLIREKYFSKEITKKDINKLSRLLSKLKHTE